MIQDFLLKQMLKSQLKNLPKDHQDKVLGAFQKNPQLFQDIALSVQERIKNGESQMSATMNVIAERKTELEQLLKS